MDGIISASLNVWLPASLCPGGLLGCLSALISLESWRGSLSIPIKCVETAPSYRCSSLSFTGQEKGTKSEKLSNL